MRSRTLVNGRQPDTSEEAEMTVVENETLAVADPEGLDAFLDAYVEAALWSTNDESDESGGEPLDANYGQDDLAPETLAKIRADCAAFLAHRLGGRLIAIAERLVSEGKWSLPAGVGCSIVEYAGHDLWLTRCGHGCGYWDGDWPAGIGEGLDKLAHEFGEVWLEVGDDGLIHGH